MTLPHETALRSVYEHNMARFKPGQVWANGSSVSRILEGPINHPMYCVDEETGEGEWHDRLALRVEPMPPREMPNGGCWIDQSSFPYLRLMVDVA